MANAAQGEFTYEATVTTGFIRYIYVNATTYASYVALDVDMTYIKVGTEL